MMRITRQVCSEKTLLTFLDIQILEIILLQLPPYQAFEFKRVFISLKKKFGQ